MRTPKQMLKIFGNGIVCGLLIFQLLFPTVNSNAGKVYKWKDKDGHWCFSDSYPAKPTENVQILNIYIPPDNFSKDHQKKNSNSGKASKRYNTTIHKGFDIESEIHDVRSDYRTLNKIINEVREEIKVKARFSRNEAIQILKTIHRTITKRHKFSSYTLYKSNCTKAHIYYAVGEALNLPIDLLTAPEHVFIRFNLDNGKHINWETSDKGQIFKNSNYIKDFNIAQTSISNGVYLRPISKNQILAHFYNQIGFKLVEDGQIEKALECYRKGIRLDSKFPELTNSVGAILLKLGENDKAIPYFNESIRLNPNYASPYNNRSIAWKIKGYLNKAKEDRKKAERLKKEFDQSLSKHQ